jgi:hypothetical protein
MDDQPELAGISLELTRMEALVFFAFLRRYSERERLAIEDQAEQRVLWDLCAMLEGELTEPLSPDYGKLLAQARDSVRDATD